MQQHNNTPTKQCRLPVQKRSGKKAKKQSGRSPKQSSVKRKKNPSRKRPTFRGYHIAMNDIEYGLDMGGGSSGNERFEKGTPITENMYEQLKVYEEFYSTDWRKANPEEKKSINYLKAGYLNGVRDWAIRDPHRRR